MMKDSSIDLLLCLPTVLSCEILFAWLFVPNLAKLDSVYCNQKKRQQLNDLFEQPELLCSLEDCPSKNIAWLLRRRIKLRDFDLRPEIPVDVATAYLREFGKLIESVSMTNDASDAVRNEASLNCPNVTTLSLESMMDASLETLNTFRSIERLVFFYASISKNAVDKGSLDLPNLRKLTICLGRGNISNIVMFVQNCPNVTHLVLMGCELIPANTATTMLSHLTGLVAVNLSCMLIDDDALTTIVHNCPAIAHFDLSKSTLITDASIFSVVTKLKLKTVALPCNYRLTNKSLEHLSHSTDTLQELHIVQNMSNGGYSNKMTQSAVRTLLRKTRNCRYTWSASIHEGECNFHNCANATTIYIDRALTDSLLEQIAQHGKSVRILDLYLSSKHVESQYTSAGLSAVINGCPILEIIRIREDLNMPQLDEVIRQHPKLFVRSFAKKYDVEKMH